jgi:hypothetical protein
LLLCLYTSGFENAATCFFDSIDIPRSLGDKDKILMVRTAHPTGSIDIPKSLGDMTDFNESTAHHTYCLPGYEAPFPD